MLRLLRSPQEYTCHFAVMGAGREREIAGTLNRRSCLSATHLPLSQMKKSTSKLEFLFIYILIFKLVQTVDVIIDVHRSITVGYYSLTCWETGKCVSWYSCGCFVSLTHLLPKHYCRPSTLLHGNYVPCWQWSLKQCALSPCKTCSEMVWRTWQRIQGVVLARKRPQSNRGTVGCAGQTRLNPRGPPCH